MCAPVTHGSGQVTSNANPDLTGQLLARRVKPVEFTDEEKALVKELVEQQAQLLQQKFEGRLRWLKQPGRELFLRVAKCIGLMKFESLPKKTLSVTCAQEAYALSGPITMSKTFEGKNCVIIRYKDSSNPNHDLVGSGYYNIHHKGQRSETLVQEEGGVYSYSLYIHQLFAPLRPLSESDLAYLDRLLKGEPCGSRIAGEKEEPVMGQSDVKLV